MLINVHCPSQDKTFSLDVSLELTLEVFKTLCQAELGAGIPLNEMQVLRDGQKLTDNSKQLLQFNLAENDFLVVERSAVPSRSTSNPPAARSTSSAGPPVLDFSSVQVPTATTSRRPAQPPQRTRPTAAVGGGGVYDDLSDVQAVANQLRNDPNTLALLRERNPTLADALLSGNMTRFGEELALIRQSRANQEMERIRMLNADPMDPEVQKKIAEEIERKNIEENMNMAIENSPESFGQVVMLWINVKVNGHSVKAFVDSGAQMTIMSSDCAKRCNIMRLMDKRFAGIAKGVGTQKILGKVHLAQIQIEDIFLPVSFSVMPDQPMDVLLGLDMLRRFQCVINLSDNSLSVATPTGNTKTYFLGEADIPSQQRITSGDIPGVSGEPSTSTAATTSSTDNQNKSDTGGDASSVAMETNKSTTTVTSSQGGGNDGNDEKLSQLVDMGFTKEEAKKELQECGGDLPNAIASLLRKRNY